MPLSSSYLPDPQYLSLGLDFADPVASAHFPRSILRFRNQNWATQVGLGNLTPDEWERHFARFEPLPENLKTPLAMRYHGHQFRVYNPDLGDGRGFLFAQLRSQKDDRLLDLGTKGSGTTPWSRSGDGRLTLKGAMREVLATEMLEALGVYTSKTFSVFETGEQLQRNDEPSPTRSAVLVRLSHGHIRFGSFQRLRFLSENENIQKLLDYSVQVYFPELQSLAPIQKPAAFLKAVAQRSGALAASWMVAGFVHGVLNTDNMNITGESFDYGPYRFLPTYNPRFTAAYFDHSGLYSFGRQPESVLWNLEQLAGALLPLSNKEDLSDALNAYGESFNRSILMGFMRRLGVTSQDSRRDTQLLSATFAFLSASQVGYDQFFFDWYGGVESSGRAERSPAAAKYQGPAFEDWKQELRHFQACSEVPTLLSHSYFSSRQPCSLLIDEIEAIWKAIDERDDWQSFEQKVQDIRDMAAIFKWSSWV